MPALARIKTKSKRNRQNRLVFVVMLAYAGMFTKLCTGIYHILRAFQPEYSTYMFVLIHAFLKEHLSYVLFFYVLLFLSIYMYSSVCIFIYIYIYLYISIYTYIIYVYLFLYLIIYIYMHIQLSYRYISS